MSHNTFLKRWQTRLLSRIVPLVHVPILWLALLVVGASPFLLLVTTGTAQAQGPAPADLFMQSVVKRDGQLGWKQLCAPLQAQVSLSALTSQLQQQRSVEASQGLTLKVDYVGVHARPQGGQIRFYVVTAHRPDGWVGQRAYIVWTQVSGCVEDVNNF